MFLCSITRVPSGAALADRFCRSPSQASLLFSASNSMLHPTSTA